MTFSIFRPLLNTDRKGAHTRGGTLTVARFSRRVFHIRVQALLPPRQPGVAKGQPPGYFGHLHLFDGVLDLKADGDGGAVCFYQQRAAGFYPGWVGPA